MAKPFSDLVHGPDNEWLTFPGGELEGRRPRRLCPSCRGQLRHGVAPKTLCFACYRLDLDRDKALKAAADLHTATEARFQDTLPLEPVNAPRLAALKVERAAERATLRAGAGRFVDRRRQAQMAARHALQTMAAGLRRQGAPHAADAAWSAAVHAAELQLPESWLPFVVSR